LHESVVPLHEARLLLDRLLSQPLVAVDVDLDGERYPGLQADVDQADPETLRRFEREIEFIGRISHPNVAQAQDSGTIGVTTFLAMEYIQGQDLHQLVKQGDPLPVGKACEYIRHSAGGAGAPGSVRLWPDPLRLMRLAG